MAIFGLDALLGAFGRIAGLEAALPALEQPLAEEMAQAMQDELGTYQEGWDTLSPETQRSRVALGFSADEPLLRLGEAESGIVGGQLRAAIRAWEEDGHWNAGIPADDPQNPIGMTQEFGGFTPNGAIIPKRSFVGPIAQDYGQRAVDGVRVTIEEAL